MIDALAHVLLAVSWKAPVVIAFGWLIATLSSPRPAVRHAFWVTVCLALLVLPALEAWKLARPDASYPLLAVEVALSAPVETSAATKDAAPTRSRFLPATLAWIYLVGLLFAAARLGLGWRRSQTLLSKAEPVLDERSVAALASIAARAGLASAPRLLSTNRLPVPVSAGVLHPAILLPASHERWDRTLLEAVLAHECAHIVRHDTRTAFAAALTRTLYWFHPAVELLVRRATRLMEQACDDHAIAITGDSRAYAKALVATASLPSTTTTQDIGALAMASQLSSRVDRVLNGFASGVGVVRSRIVAGLAAGALTCTFAAALLTPVWAQRGGVALEGVVVDASGARVPGVSILLQEAGLGIREATVSGPDGAFAIRGLQPSERYEIETEAMGFAPGRQTVVLMENRSVELRMDVGRIRESIVVQADAPQQPAARRSPQRIRIGGQIQRARMIRQVRPEYPEDARDEGVEGTVLLEAVISVAGQPVSLNAVNNLVDGRLVAAAREAVSQWRYQPTLLNGEPVEVVTMVTVGFQLRR